MYRPFITWGFDTSHTFPLECKIRLTNPRKENLLMRSIPLFCRSEWSTLSLDLFNRAFSCYIIAAMLEGKSNTFSLLWEIKYIFMQNCLIVSALQHGHCENPRENRDNRRTMTGLEM